MVEQVHVPVNVISVHPEITDLEAEMMQINEQSAASTQNATKKCDSFRRIFVHKAIPAKASLSIPRDRHLH
jgi:hypothetical protein